MAQGRPPRGLLCPGCGAGLEPLGEGAGGTDPGPVLARTDAPLLFTVVNEVARRLGVKPPGQIRLTYLPCCGMVAWGRSQALVLGLPLLRVLTLAELRSVIAHELAHLARGDA